MYYGALVLERAIISSFFFRFCFCSVRTVVEPFQTDERYPICGGKKNTWENTLQMFVT